MSANMEKVFHMAEVSDNSVLYFHFCTGEHLIQKDGLYLKEEERKFMEEISVNLDMQKTPPWQKTDNIMADNRQPISRKQQWLKTTAEKD